LFFFAHWAFSYFERNIYKWGYDNFLSVALLPVTDFLR
jgi:hypothetical protein